MAALASSDPKPGPRIERPVAGVILALQQALEGRYALERELGRGGMGIVYLAWETALERWVALKILPPELATPARRQRFLREARIAARLEHDNIVTIHTVDEAGTFVYYTMAYIAGETLAERIIAEGALPVSEVTRILHDVARAVHYAHTRGVVHRDLKPNNILIERESGRPYVADFGIARVMSEEPPAGGGRTFGTFAYLSPEQAAGLPADQRSDVYSLGVVGWFMATGLPLFTGKPREVVRQHVATPSPPLPVVGVHEDTTLSRAVGRCLAKDPRARFQTADELAHALSLAPEVRSELPEPLGQFLSELRVQQAKSVGGGLLLGVATVGVLGSAVQAGHWGTAAGAVGFLGLVLAWPIAAALPATRRLLAKGHGRRDIVHALSMDLDRQREELAGRSGAMTDATATLARRILVFALGLFGFGAVAAVSGIDLPLRLVLGSIIGGACTALVAGGVVVWQERRRNELWGRRWLRFWRSRLGEWAVKVAGIGLGRVPVEAELSQSQPTAFPLPAEPAPAEPSNVDELQDVVQLSESCVRQIDARLAASAVTRAREGRTPTVEELELEEELERKLAVLEGLLEKFRSVDAGAGLSGSLTADLEAARAVCERVQALISGWHS